MTDYELTVLLKPALSEKELDKEVKGLGDILEKAGVKVTKKVDAVKKTLAYEMKKVKEAYYAYFELSMKPSDVAVIEQKLKLVDNIVRYLVVVSYK
ncbi:30S ribosomal protein S6 [Candidatus Microgenomates bacterium]|nr:30S ribosomal protein S6 [Candidatus Microgenomates bacterium]